MRFYKVFFHTKHDAGEIETRRAQRCLASFTGFPATTTMDIQAGAARGRLAVAAYLQQTPSWGHQVKVDHLLMEAHMFRGDSIAQAQLGCAHAMTQPRIDQLIMLHAGTVRITDFPAWRQWHLDMANTLMLHSNQVSPQVRDYVAAVTQHHQNHSASPIPKLDGCEQVTEGRAPPRTGPGGMPEEPPSYDDSNAWLEAQPRQADVQLRPQRLSGRIGEHDPDVAAEGGAAEQQARHQSRPRHHGGAPRRHGIGPQAR
jgi:hypothetical protein